MNSIPLTNTMTNVIRAPPRLVDILTIPYNLACYCAQLGRLDDARDWLKRAFEVTGKRGEAKDLRLQALADPDLEPLWREIGGISA